MSKEEANNVSKEETQVKTKRDTYVYDAPRPIAYVEKDGTIMRVSDLEEGGAASDDK